MNKDDHVLSVLKLHSFAAIKQPRVTLRSSDKGLLIYKRMRRPMERNALYRQCRHQVEKEDFLKKFHRVWSKSRFVSTVIEIYSFNCPKTAHEVRCYSEI